jgi:small subunit ribosomal protein S16
MALVIRLTRVGKKKDASFRVVVIDSKRKVQAGNYLEMVGSYDPRFNTSDLKADRIKHWISMGAKPSDTLHNLLISNKILSGKKINVLPKKVLAKPEPAAEAAPAEAPAAEVAAEAAPEAAPEAETPAAEAVETPAEAPSEEAPAAAAEDNAVVEEKAAE